MADSFRKWFSVTNLQPRSLITRCNTKPIFLCVTFQKAFIYGCWTKNRGKNPNHPFVHRVAPIIFTIHFGVITTLGWPRRVGRYKLARHIPSYSGKNPGTNHWPTITKLRTNIRGSTTPNHLGLQYTPDLPVPYARWWFQPVWKILVKLDHLPR